MSKILIFILSLSVFPSFIFQNINNLFDKEIKNTNTENLSSVLVDTNNFKATSTIEGINKIKVNKDSKAVINVSTTTLKNSNHKCDSLKEEYQKLKTSNDLEISKIQKEQETFLQSQNVNSNTNQIEDLGDQIKRLQYVTSKTNDYQENINSLRDEYNILGSKVIESGCLSNNK